MIHDTNTIHDLTRKNRWKI